MLLARETLHRNSGGKQDKEVSIAVLAYRHVQLYVDLNSLFLTVTGNMSATANSAHSILLSHTFIKSGVYYVCNVTEVKSREKKAVNKNVTTHPTNVTGLLPDTTYRVDCVAYHSDGVEACLEANTTVTTCELQINLSLCNTNICAYVHVLSL